MPNSKLYNVKTTLSNGTVIESGTIEVPQGEPGTNGLDALEYSGNISIGVTPVPTLTNTINANNCNRTPIVGDKFILNWKNVTTGKSFLCGCTITQNIDSTNWSFRVDSVTETAGNNGNDALVMTTSFSSSTAPTAGASYYFPDTSFNRKPIVGEFCNMTWIDTNANDTYTCICSVDSYTSEAQLSVMSFHKISAAGFCLHLVNVSWGAGANFANLLIMNNDPTPFTSDTLYNYLTKFSNGTNRTDPVYPATGNYGYGQTLGSEKVYAIFGITAPPTSNTFYFWVGYTTNGAVTTTSIAKDSVIVSDKVVEM